LNFKIEQVSGNKYAVFIGYKSYQKSYRWVAEFQCLKDAEEYVARKKERYVPNGTMS